MLDMIKKEMFSDSSGPRGRIGRYLILPGAEGEMGGGSCRHPQVCGPQKQGSQLHRALLAQRPLNPGLAAQRAQDIDNSHSSVLLCPSPSPVAWPAQKVLSLLPKEGPSVVILQRSMTKDGHTVDKEAHSCHVPLHTSPTGLLLSSPLLGH